MDIERIRGLPIEDFLARLGHHPAMRKRNDLWYNAPYREEKTPSFKVNTTEISGSISGQDAAAIFLLLPGS